MYKVIVAKRIKLFLAVILFMFAIVFVMNNFLKIIYPLKYKEYVFKYSVQNNIDPYLVFAVIKAESGFDPNATSHKNAKGLMQISEGTAKWGAESLKIILSDMNELYSPETNIALGTWYIAKLMKQFNNNSDLVLAAYNGGSGNVNEWLKSNELAYNQGKIENIPFKETDRFVKKVRIYYSIYMKLYKRNI